MRRLATSSDLRETMGRAARERIVSQFTWELSARRLLAALGADENRLGAPSEG